MGRFFRTGSAMWPLLREVAALPPGGRSRFLQQRVVGQPRCPVTRFLLGCEALDRGRIATAVRHMMVAHHSEPDFESAALLVFAGLKWGPQSTRPLLAVLLETWEEFRRPAFDRTRREKLLLDAFAEPLDVRGPLSSLARRLWRLPVRTLRAQIREAVAGDAAQRYPLLVSPAQA